MILAIDFDGALLKHRPFRKANETWFKVLSILIGDDSITKYANTPDYFDQVHEAMGKYLGDVDHETRVLFARNLYAMSIIAETTKEDLVVEFVECLRSVKEKYTLALITTAPESSVEPTLQKIGCSDLFDIVYKSPMDRHPNKKELFSEFISKHEKPTFYIGNGDKDIENAKAVGIKTISVNWVSKGNVKGDHDVDTVEELKEIL